MSSEEGIDSELQRSLEDLDEEFNQSENSDDDK